MATQSRPLVQWFNEAAGITPRAGHKLHIAQVWLDARADNAQQLSRHVRLRNECKAQKLPDMTSYHNLGINIYLRGAKTINQRLREALAHGMI